MTSAIDYAALPLWENYSRELATELLQCQDEGLAIGHLRPLAEAILALPDSPEKSALADSFFQLLQKAPLRPDYPFEEPSDLEGIRALRPAAPDLPSPDAGTLPEKIRGAWHGRIIGCLLGKTVKGIMTAELLPFLKESGNYPLHRYIRSTDLPAGWRERYRFDFQAVCFADRLPCAPPDDDTNYTVLAQRLVSRHGRDFTSEDLARTWLDSQPKTAYCTAERVAFCNLVKGLPVPACATYQNPYREWIGAQIRGDYFGYINPGDPAQAAEMAHRDARVSHVKNGIYGEMLIAAMLAAAPCTRDRQAILQAGLGQIPRDCRLAAEIREIVSALERGASREDLFKALHSRYNERQGHDWCHTISNACLVVIAFLTAQDFSDAICRVVEQGFDTDCNGATVGSLYGMAEGFGAIPGEWLAPLSGQLDTSLNGSARIPIDDLVRKTLEHLA